MELHDARFLIKSQGLLELGKGTELIWLYKYNNGKGGDKRDSRFHIGGVQRVTPRYKTLLGKGLNVRSDNLSIFHLLSKNAWNRL
jgi:hypothetical protein